MKTLLWIDDDVDLLVGLGVHLREINGLSVLEVRSAREATDVLRSTSVDLLMSDMAILVDDERVLLSRGIPFDVALIAFKGGCRRFVAYTGLSRGEVEGSLEEPLTREASKAGVTIDFQYFSKHTSHLTDLARHVQDSLFG